jgi:hypothetical protein
MANDRSDPPGDRSPDREKRPPRRPSATRRRGNKKQGRKLPPATQDQIDARELMAAERQLRRVSCQELDRRIRAPVGFTSRLLSGLTPFNEERALKLRAAMGYDEERFQQDMLYRKAYRKVARGTSWIRSPHQRRAGNSGSAPPVVTENRAEEGEVAPRRSPMPAALPLFDELLAQVRDRSMDPGREQAAPAGGAKRTKKPRAPG